MSRCFLACDDGGRRASGDCAADVKLPLGHIVRDFALLRRVAPRRRKTQSSLRGRTNLWCRLREFPKQSRGAQARYRLHEEGPLSPGGPFSGFAIEAAGKDCFRPDSQSNLLCQPLGCGRPPPRNPPAPSIRDVGYRWHRSSQRPPRIPVLGTVRFLDGNSMCGSYGEACGRNPERTQTSSLRDTDAEAVHEQRNHPPSFLELSGRGGRAQQTHRPPEFRG